VGKGRKRQENGGPETRIKSDGRPGYKGAVRSGYFGGAPATAFDSRFFWHDGDTLGHLPLGIFVQVSVQPLHCHQRFPVAMVALPFEARPVAGEGRLCKLPVKPSTSVCVTQALGSHFCFFVKMQASRPLSGGTFRSASEKTHFVGEFSGGD